MAKVKAIKLYPALRKELLQACIDEWNYIGDETCLLCGGSVTAAETREMVGDRVEHPKWNRISREDQESILEEAFPRGSVI